MKRDRRPLLRNCCLGGCVGIPVLAILIFSIAYSFTGRYHVTIPPPAQPPNPNGYDGLIAAGRMLKSNGGTAAIYPPSGSTAPSPTAEAAVVSRNQPVLANLHTAVWQACLAPPNRHSYDLMPYLASFRDMARLLWVDQDLRLRRGDYRGAFSAGLDGLQMGEQIPRGGTLIHRLVGRACQEIVRPKMVEATDHLSAHDCGEFAGRLQQMLLDEDAFANVLRQERASALTIADSPREMLDNFMATGGSAPPQDEAREAAFAMTWHFTRDRALRELDQYYSRMIEESQKPIVQQRAVPEPTSPIAAILVPVLSDAQKREATRTARNRILLCAVAIRAYRLAHGRVPDSLQALGLDQRVVADPFGVGPLAYRALGRDYLLYSFGPDLKDDGGVPMDEPKLDSPGDIGIRRLQTVDPQSHTLPSSYRLVPHMRPPKLPPGSPPLRP